MSYARVAFRSLDEAEVELVRSAVRFAARHRLELLAIVATRSGNGWLYPLLSVFFVVTGRVAQPVRFVTSSGLTFALAFTIYPLLKRFLKRSRPCHYDDSLGGELAPLDRYSCPSGHAMTAAAYSVPLLFACPSAAPLAVSLCLLIAWSRVALGHHYVSDVIIGTAIGAAVATPIALCLL
jgi:undecaprenyl-diphosphatase